MTYGFRAVCRRRGCSAPVSTGPVSCEGDVGWCEAHRAEVVRVREVFAERRASPRRRALKYEDAGRKRRRPPGLKPGAK